MLDFGADFCSRIDISPEFSFEHMLEFLTSELWKDLKLKCPRLRRLYLEGIGDTCNDPWIDASGLYELKELQVRVDIPAVTRIDHLAIDVGFPSI